MQVVYDETFNSLVKACILKEAKGYEPVTKANLKSTDFTSVADHEMNELLVEWDWVHGTPHNISALEQAIELALRHKYGSKDLLFSIISQALQFGVDYVLTRRSIEAKRFCNLVCSVREELRSAKLNIKFTRHGQTLFGKYVFSHKIADLLLQFYQKRFPEKQVVIVNNFNSYHLENQRVMQRPAITTPIASATTPQNALTLNAFF